MFRCVSDMIYFGMKQIHVKLKFIKYYYLK